MKSMQEEERTNSLPHSMQHRRSLRARLFTRSFTEEPRKETGDNLAAQHLTTDRGHIKKIQEATERRVDRDGIRDQYDEQMMLAEKAGAVRELSKAEAEQWQGGDSSGFTFQLIKK